jgi:hypothetical protein
MLMDSTLPSKTLSIKKEDPTICCLQETHIIDRNQHCFRVKVGIRFNKLMVPENSQE